jgi:hypothetical protein
LLWIEEKAYEVGVMWSQIVDENVKNLFCHFISSSTFGNKVIVIIPIVLCLRMIWRWISLAKIRKKCINECIMKLWSVGVEKTRFLWNPIWLKWKKSSLCIRERWKIPIRKFWLHIFENCL